MRFHSVQGTRAVLSHSLLHLKNVDADDIAALADMRICGAQRASLINFNTSDRRWGVAY